MRGNENTEKVEDIVKELRRQSDSESKLATQLRKTDDDVDFVLASCYADDAKYLSKIADRLEAAWKRDAAIHAMTCEANERLREHLDIALKANKVGNAAAMRDALRTLRQRFDNNVMAYQDRYFKFSEWHWHKKAAEAARWRDVFLELREACDAALSAPARNCDLPLVVDGPADNNADKAWLVFKHHNPDAYFDVFGLLRCIDWLLAPAAKKGE